MNELTLTLNGNNGEVKTAKIALKVLKDLNKLHGQPSAVSTVWMMVDELMREQGITLD